MVNFKPVTCNVVTIDPCGVFYTRGNAYYTYTHI